MSLDTLVSNYKLLPYSRRLILVVVLAVLPIFWTLFEDLPLLQEEKATATSARQAAEVKFQRARERKSNLPKLEEQLAFTERELKEASKRLPDEFVMEKILQKTSMIAQDLGVDLRAFDPGEGAPVGTEFKYVEMPISIQVTGSYGQIASFFDRIVHLELLVHIKDLRIELTTVPEEAADPNGAIAQAGAAAGQADLANQNKETLNIEQQQRKSREKSLLLASADMVVFRTLSPDEERAIAVVAAPAAKKKEKQDNEEQTDGSDSSDESSQTEDGEGSEESQEENTEDNAEQTEEEA